MENIKKFEEIIFNLKQVSKNTLPNNGASLDMINKIKFISENLEFIKNNFKDFIQAPSIYNTVEGDLIIYDILYYEKSDKVYVVTDNTRDEYAATDNKKIELKEYNNIGTYQNSTGLYWVAYNEQINEENFNTENTFLITKIN